MNIGFNGFCENTVTFEADETVRKGSLVKIINDNTVSACESGDKVCGVCVNVREGYAAVQLNGYAEIPVILGGDFNATKGSKELRALDSSKLMRNAIETADIYANKNTHTAHNFSIMPHTGTGMIDHIYISTDTVTVLRQDLVADGVVIQGSDHCPVYADIILR